MGGIEIQLHSFLTSTLDGVSSYMYAQVASIPWNPNAVRRASITEKYLGPTGNPTTFLGCQVV